MIGRLVILLLGLLTASPAFAAGPEYCAASVAVAGGQLTATVFPDRPNGSFTWSDGDREAGAVTLFYGGDPSALQLDRVTVVVGKDGDRAPAKALHRAKEGDFLVELGQRQWRWFWRDRWRWADPTWVMIADLSIEDSPQEVGGPLTVSFLQGKGRTAHSLALTAPTSAELADAAPKALALAKEAARTGQGCFYREVEVDEVI